jgi:cbb3-type cytochrome oxidase maturation protein
MKIMLLLILLSLILAAGFLLVYLWAARDGQFDDDYTPAVRILFDDETNGVVIPSPPDQNTGV